MPPGLLGTPDPQEKQESRKAELVSGQAATSLLRLKQDRAVLGQENISSEVSVSPSVRCGED